MLPAPLILCALAAIAPAVSTPAIHAERIRLQSGAEVLTLFEQFPGGEIPILAEQDGKVWVFTYSPPSLAQRAAAGIPFFYHRSGLEGSPGTKPPKPVLDLKRPARGVWEGVALALIQTHVFDPFGMISRLTTRSYGGNLGSLRRAHIREAVDVLNELAPEDYDQLTARLELSGKLFGGLVTNDRLSAFAEKAEQARAENRGHNWELLRQSAEENGLIFQPLQTTEMPGSFAMISVAREDLAAGGPKRFSRQFLRISNPFRDERLLKQTGIIPLAVYALDYPKVPLLLVDFRHPEGPRFSEMGLRAADDITTGVLGFTGFGNLDYMALKSSWMFVYTRHGGTTNRGARERAFVQFRHALGTDRSLDPELRKNLMSKLERLQVDPVGRTWDQEVRGAWQQFDSLVNSGL
jgi:hypothetical protein